MFHVEHYLRAYVPRGTDEKEDKMTGTIHSADTIYHVNSLGEVTSPQWETPSQQWVICGAVRYNNFGYQIDNIPFEALHTLNGHWKYRNNMQCWHIIDVDHGTHRVWMSPGHTAVFSQHGS